MKTEADFYPEALAIVAKYAPGEMGLANHLARRFFEIATEAAAPPPVPEPPGSVGWHVSPIRAYEDNTGPLESTDLFLSGRGVSLLVNMTIEGELTYCLGIDGQERRSGTIDWKTAPPPVPEPPCPMCDQISGHRVGCPNV